MTVHNVWFERMWQRWCERKEALKDESAFKPIAIESMGRQLKELDDMLYTIHAVVSIGWYGHESDPSQYLIKVWVLREDAVELERVHDDVSKFIRRIVPIHVKVNILVGYVKTAIRHSPTA